MTVYFVGAGPGDPELITVKGQRLLKQADAVFYAGSLIPAPLLDWAAPSAPKINTAELHLDDIMDGIRRLWKPQSTVVRLQCGDPSFYSAIAEQMDRLQKLGIPWEIVPGVSTVSAASAALNCELTLPGISQTLIFTRYPGKTPFPQKEAWASLAHSGACLAIFLSVTRLHKICDELIPVYGEDYPVAVCYRIGWPEQTVIRGTLADIVAKVRQAKINRTALIVMGEVLRHGDFDPSFLYDADKAHIYRPKYRRKSGKS